MTYADSRRIIELMREIRLLKEQLEEARIWEHTARANGEDYRRLLSERAVVQTHPRPRRTSAK